MSVHLIIELTIDDTDTYAEYARAVPNTLLRYGGRYLARGGEIVPLAGDWHPERLVVVEFPSRVEFERWVRSPEYASLAPLRERAARTRSLLVEAVDRGRPTLVPELYVTDLDGSLSFYLDGLGFALDYARPEQGFASIYLGSAHLMLEQTAGFGPASPGQLASGYLCTADLEPPFGRGLNLEIRVSDLDGIRQRLSEQGHPILLEPHARSFRVHDMWLDVRQMLVADPDGYLLRLSERQRLRPGP